MRMIPTSSLLLIVLNVSSINGRGVSVCMYERGEGGAITLRINIVGDGIKGGRAQHTSHREYHQRLTELSPVLSLTQ